MYPIKTFVGKNTVVKVCTEDVSKIVKNVRSLLQELNLCIEEMFYNNWYSDSKNGFYIESKGKAVCDDKDEFDLETGEEIAFRKVKLIANIKKFRMLSRIINKVNDILDSLIDLRTRYAEYITKDQIALEKYNPDFDYNI